MYSIEYTYIYASETKAIILLCLKYDNFFSTVYSLFNFWDSVAGDRNRDKDHTTRAPLASIITGCSIKICLNQIRQV